jgi:hypothetical protein
MSSLKTRFWLLIFTLITAPFCQAAEVAMVTDGQASAMLDDQIWSVEIAEILPENVKLTVGSEQQLGLIHLLNNKEYQIPANAQVTLLKEGIKGIADNGKKIELVMNDTDLGDDMDDQTGAASLGRIFNPESISTSRSMRPSVPATSGNSEVQEQILKKQKADPSKQISKEKKDMNKDQIIDSFEELEQVEFESDRVILPTSYLVVAMPSEAAKAAELKETQRLGNANLEIFKTEQQNNWNILYVKQLEPKKLDYKINLNALTGLAPMSLVYLEPAKISLANAIKLEKYKLYYQAAGAWFELASKNKISQRVLKQHLNRLNQLINKN